MRSGFTLIETLLSLMIISLVAGAALESHFFAARAEHRARSYHGLRMGVRTLESRIFAEDGAPIPGKLPPGIRAEPVDAPHGTGVVALVRWTAADSSLPSARIEFYTLRETAAPDPAE